jgi:hypothetical protein
MSELSSPRMQYPDRDEVGSGCGPWCAPLHMVERVVGAHPDGRHFDVDDFMICGKLLRRRPPDIFLYKHGVTRRYLNVDDAGHTYRYYPPRGERGNGQYRRHRDLTAAIDALDLWMMSNSAGTAWTEPPTSDVVR